MNLLYKVKKYCRFLEIIIDAKPRSIVDCSCYDRHGMVGRKIIWPQIHNIPPWI
jgi:hypothetical protein